MERIILMAADGKGRGVEWDSPLPDQIALELVPTEIRAELSCTEAFVRSPRVVDGAVVYEEVETR